MKKLLSLALVSLLLINAPVTKAEAPTTEPRIEPLTIPELVDKYAEKYGVSKDLAHYIAINESHYDPLAKGDLNITCRNSKSPHNGEAVYARGVYQLTRCYYPEVSDMEAFDPETNIKIAMQIIAKGKTMCMSQFTTCRDYYQQ